MKDDEELLLVSSVKRYLNYIQNLDCNSYELIGFPVNCQFYDFNKLVNNSLKNLSELISSLNNDKKLKLYSLQRFNNKISARQYWRSKTYYALNNNTDGCFIFIYDSGEENLVESKRNYKNLNSTNPDFCHSLLFRDYVKKNKIGFEIDLSLQSDKYFSEFEQELDNKKSVLGNNNISFQKSNIKKIINSFNFYFPKANLQTLHYIYYITDYYAYNFNCHAFKEISPNYYLLEAIKISEIDSGHDLYGSVINKLKKGDSNGISKLSKWLAYVNILTSLTKLLVYYSETKQNDLKILLLDDHPGKMQEEIEQLNCWLNTKIEYIIAEDQPSTVNKIDELFNVLLNKTKTIDETIRKIKEGIEKGEYHFIIIDLDYEGELKGFEYLRKLRKIKSVYDPPYVIVFSRSEDSESIQKALNMGALFFASKQNFAHLLLEIFKAIPIIKQLRNKEENLYSLGNNWNLLYQLPLAKILELRTKVIDRNLYLPYEVNNSKYGFVDKKILESKEDYLWIKKLPKAELHNHIGSVLGSELIVRTSLLVLSQKYSKHNNYQNISTIIKFILPIVTDPFLNETNDVALSNGNDNSFKHWYNLKQIFICDASTQFFNQSIFTIITNSLNLKLHKKTPEEVLLSPTDDTLENHFHPFSKLANSVYFRTKIELRKKNVNYDEVMLFFILLMDIRQKLSNNLPLKKILNDTKAEIKQIFKVKKKPFAFPGSDIDIFIEKLNNEKNNKLLQYLKDNIYQYDEYLLNSLISAHSKQRCLPYENRGLFNYLRGCEYGGAPHLQSKESIFLAAHHIIFNYAIPDNIRYLDLRCSIDGYNKFQLFDKTNAQKNISKNGSNPFDEVVQALIKSFSFWQEYAFEKINKKVHVNLIVTAKRHKSLKEFEKNVELTVNNYNLHNGHEYKKRNSFFPNKTEIVSFDIAGLEKNNRISKFKDQIKPLLDKCVPITMHAGEEDSHESIWEAFYLAHAQRLGHALTLEDNNELKNLVRESFVNIELCPISNYLTNNKYMFKKESKEYPIKEYPIKKYLKERLSVSINTDNPYVSDSTLTKEFLFASKIYGGLTRWQILKLILYSFKSITIHKNLKSILMKEINEEIFKLILEESELC